MKKIIVLIILALSFNYSLCQINYSANSDFNVIVGRITDKNNNGISGIKIGLKNQSNSQETTTDSLGNFSIFARITDELLVIYENNKPINISLTNTPKIYNGVYFNLYLSYENITNVSGEHSAEMSVNTFVFPPLSGYTLTMLSNSIFSDCKYLSDVDRKIDNALDILGYDEKSYFLIPNGFAVVTRIESINPNGTSLKNGQRFSINESKSISFSDFFSPEKGYYRLFAFLITNMPFKPNEKIANFEKASTWSTVGYNILPVIVKNKLFSPSYRCSVIVYEFTSERPNTTLKLHFPTISANNHLKFSKLLTVLNQH